MSEFVEFTQRARDAMKIVHKEIGKNRRYLHMKRMDINTELRRLNDEIQKLDFQDTLLRIAEASTDDATKAAALEEVDRLDAGPSVAG